MGPILNRVNGMHTLIIQCLSMIHSLLRVKGLYVLNNTFVLSIFVHCNLHAQRFVVTSAKQCIFLNLV